MTDITTASDPTKTLLSKSKLHNKYLCDLIVNVASGCRHGCVFCYVPGTPNIRTRKAMLRNEAGIENPQEEWGEYVLYRDQIPHKLPKVVERKQSWKETEKGQGIVGISFHTDAFMDERAARLALQATRILTDRGHHVRILTRAPMNAATIPVRRDPAGRVTLRGVDVLARAGDRVTIGASINSLDNDELLALEQHAPPVETRLAGLKRFADAGVNTFVSMSPTYPTLGRDDIGTLLDRLAAVDPDVIFHEPINPRGDNFDLTVAAAEMAGQEELARALTTIQSPTAWKDYACEHFRAVQELGQDRGLPIHLWPDKQLVADCTGDRHRWLKAWRNRQSPESFAGRPTPSTAPPMPPSTQSHQQRLVDHTDQ